MLLCTTVVCSRLRSVCDRACRCKRRTIRPVSHVALATDEYKLSEFRDLAFLTLRIVVASLGD